MSVVLIISTIGSALAARFVIKTGKDLLSTSRITGKSAFHYFFPGGFLPKMSRKEASLILDVREFSPKEDIKSAYKRAMISNHPDRGGSPYIAAKITEAKHVMDS